MTERLTERLTKSREDCGRHGKLIDREKSNKFSVAAQSTRKRIVRTHRGRSKRQIGLDDENRLANQIILENGLQFAIKIEDTFKRLLKVSRGSKNL